MFLLRRWVAASKNKQTKFMSMCPSVQGLMFFRKRELQLLTKINEHYMNTIHSNKNAASLFIKANKAKQKSYFFNLI